MRRTTFLRVLPAAVAAFATVRGLKPTPPITGRHYDLIIVDDLRINVATPVWTEEQLQEIRDHIARAVAVPRHILYGGTRHISL